MIAFVIGGSSNVRREIDQAYSLITPDMVVVVNDIGASPSFTANFDHWVTLHPDNWEHLLVARAKLGQSFSFQRWSPLAMVEEKVGYLDTFTPSLNLLDDYEPSGLSGLYGVKVALHCGADKVILVGIPMDQSGHYSGNTKKHWINVRRCRSWAIQQQLLMGRVKSLSGYTAELLGVPTEEWLNGSKTQAQTSIGFRQEV